MYLNSRVKEMKTIQHGFTLVELLMVVLLLGVIAATTFAFVAEEDVQSRYDATKSYLSSIKKAIVGDSEADSISGFYADMGRFPGCMRELVLGVYCNADIVDDSDGDGAGIDPLELLPVWGQDDESTVWSGWRGPYLQALPESVGLAYRDGWKNQGLGDSDTTVDINYGWLVGTGESAGTACDAATNLTQPAANEMTLQSCGSDRQVTIATATGYEKDYPPSFNGVVPPLVNEHDVLVRLGGDWVSIPVRIQNDTGGDVNVTANSLYAKINYPNDGVVLGVWGGADADPQLDSAIERDESPFLSASFPQVLTKLLPNSGVLAVSAGETITFPAGTTQDGTTLTVPNAGNVVFNADTSQLSLIDCPCEITIPATSTFATNILTIAADGDMVFTNKQVDAMQADLMTNKRFISLPSDVTIGASGTQITLKNGAVLNFASAYNGHYAPHVMMSSDTFDVVGNFSLQGNKLTTEVGGNISVVSVPVNTTVSGTTITIPESNAMPVGLHSMTLVCADSGDLYDSDCSDNATTYNPVGTPYSLKASQRAVIQAPNVLIWNIQ